jgi:hypothetical protein
VDGTGSRGEEGDSEGELTGGGDDGEQPQSCRRRKARRPAPAPMEGDAPANLRPRGGAEEVQLGEAKLLVWSVRSGGAPNRRIGAPCGSGGGDVVQGARSGAGGDRGRARGSRPRPL